MEFLWQILIKVEICVLFGVFLSHHLKFCAELLMPILWWPLSDHSEINESREQNISRKQYYISISDIAVLSPTVNSLTLRRFHFNSSPLGQKVDCAILVLYNDKKCQYVFCMFQQFTAEVKSRLNKPSHGLPNLFVDHDFSSLDCDSVKEDFLCSGLDHKFFSNRKTKWVFLCCLDFHECQRFNYPKISNINCTKFQHLNVSRFSLQLSLRNKLKPSVKGRMKM